MDPVSQRIWTPRSGEPEPQQSAELQDTLGLSPLVARILVSRGFDGQSAPPFLEARLAKFEVDSEAKSAKSASSSAKSKNNP